MIRWGTLNSTPSSNLGFNSIIVKPIHIKRSFSHIIQNALANLTKQHFCAAQYLYRLSTKKNIFRSKKKRLAKGRNELKIINVKLKTKKIKLSLPLQFSSMGNTQSNAKGESGNDGQNGGGGNDSISRLSRFNTGLSTDSSSGFQSLAPNVSPQLRRLSTTATGSAAHHERSHRKRGISHGGSNLSPVSTNDESSGGVGGGGSANLLKAFSSDRRASASASSSPRTLEREQAWMRSALPGGGSTRTTPSTSSNRNRSRSGSIGNLLSGGSSRKSSVRAYSGNQNDGAAGTFTPAGGRGSELVFRRKKSIELSDLDTGLTFSGTEPSR